MDTYYGVSYQKDHQLIGSEDLMTLKETGITEADLVMLDINRAEYDLEQLQIGWESDWMVQFYGDERVTFAH